MLEISTLRKILWITLVAFPIGLLASNIAGVNKLVPSAYADGAGNYRSNDIFDIKKQPDKKTLKSGSGKKDEAKPASYYKALYEAEEERFTVEGRNVNQQIEDLETRKSAIRKARDAIDEAMIELDKADLNNRSLEEATSSWSANPYGEGRLKKNAGTKAAMTAAARLITGAFNPYTFGLGFVKDVGEGVARKYFKYAAQAEIMKNNKSIGQAIKNTYGRYKELGLRLKELDEDIRGLKIRSNTLLNMFEDWRLAARREKAAKPPGTKRASSKAVTERVPGLESLEDEIFNLKKQELKRETGQPCE